MRTNSNEQYDLIVIGGGVGGLVTAAGASQLGAKVALIDKEALGGDCLHYGCVPTKRLVHSAKVASLIRRAGEFGVEGTDSARVNFEKLMRAMREIQAEIGKNDAPERFEKMGVKVILGEGKFADPYQFQVNGETLKGKKFLIATGSSPFVPPIPGLKEIGFLTNVTALQLDHLPKSVIVLGAGPIGIEFSQIFHRLGAKVTIVKKTPQILPKEDREMADALEQILKKEGIEILTGEVNEVHRENGMRGVTCRGEQGVSQVKGEEILVAVGRSPNVAGLNLEAAGVAYDRQRGIRVDETLRTTARHIWACGDVIGQYLFTHVAEYHAGIVVSNVLFPFLRRKVNYRVVPWTTYTDPELGRIGVTEDQAKEERGEKNIQLFRFYFKDVDRAVIEGEGHGLIKLVVDRKNRLLGAHLLGPHAGELLHEYVLAMKKQIPITDISQTIHVYPTLAQSVKRACDQYYRVKLFSGWFPKFSRWLIRIQRFSPPSMRGVRRG